MTVNSSEPNKVSAATNGSATSFSFSPMVIYEASNMTVVLVDDATGVETPLSQGSGSSNYSVSPTGSYPSSGSIIYPADEVTPKASGFTLVMKPVFPLEQQTNLNNQGGYHADVQEEQFDKLLKIDKQQQEQLDRAFSFPIGYSGSATAEIPAPTAGYIMRWNSAGTALENILAASLGTAVLSDTDPAVAGAASPGISSEVSRQDHVHPSPKDVVEALTNKTVNSALNTVGADHVHVKVRNTAGYTLPKGTVLKATGYNADQDCIEVDETSSTADIAFGALSSDLENNTNGLAVNTGVINGVDTSAFAVGAKLYSDGSGGFTDTKPTSGLFQTCGFVLRSNDTSGRLYVEFTDQSNAAAVEADVSKTLTKGMLAGSHSLGNLNSATTLHISDGNLQNATVTGSFTLTAPDDTDEGYINLELTIDGTGGYTLTLSGFNEVSGVVDMTAGSVNYLRICKHVTNTTLEVIKAV